MITLGNPQGTSCLSASPSLGRNVPVGAGVAELWGELAGGEIKDPFLAMTLRSGGGKLVRETATQKGKRSCRRRERTFTKEFKVEAVQLVQTSGKSMAQIARDLGIADSTLHHWCKLLSEQGEQAFAFQRASDRARRGNSPLEARK